MDINEKRKIYFDSIQKYAIGDLEWMLEHANYNGEFQRLAVPIAQACFSVLDILGLLHRSDAYAITEKQTSANIKKGMDIFLTEIPSNDRDRLVNFFRNGVVHTFLPHAGGKIFNDKNENSILTPSGHYLHFNVNPFAKKLILSFENYRQTYDEVMHSDFNTVSFQEFIRINEAKLQNVQFQNQTISSGITTTSLPIVNR
jgi:hypothetical protein